MKHSNSKGRSIFIHPILKGKKEKKTLKTLVSLQYRFIFSEQTVPHIKSIKPYHKVETAQPILQEQNITKIPQLYAVN